MSNKDTIYRQDATKHIKHRLYETAMNNDDLAGVFSEIADNRIETWIEEVPSADPDVITMRVDIDKEQFARAWKQTLANSPLTVFPDEEPDTGLYVDGFDDGFKAGTQRWIPVTERLPEEDVEVLIAYRYKEGEGDTSHTDIAITTYGQMYFGGNKVGDNKCWRQPFEYFTSNYEVVAWMPLPDPYKEEEDER